MTDFARLVLAADSSQLAQAEAQIERVAATGERTEKRVGTASTLMSASFRRVSIAAASMAGALIGTLASGRFFSNAIRETEQLERNMFRLRQIIQTTGGVAGKTAEGLHAQARELASVTLASTEGVMQAQQTLLTFRNIRGQVFDDAIAAALDMSEALGTDLQSSIMQVAKALEDPVRGMTALSRSGTVFTESQREMVRAMVEAGEVAEAQRFIMSELEAQYGGTAEAAAQGLAGAADTLSQAWQEMSISLSEAFGLNAAAEATIRGLSSAVELLRDNMDLVRGVAIAGAITLTTIYLPAVVSATGATLAWIAALITLRGALLMSGIGALVVGAGYLIAQFLTLTEKADGFGVAMSMLGDVAEEVWDRIKTGGNALELSLSANWQNMRAVFLGALADMMEEFGAFARQIGQVMQYLPGMQSMGVSLMGAGDGSGLREASDAAYSAGGTASRGAETLWDKATGPLESLKALRDVMAETREEAAGLTDTTLALNDALSGLGGSEDGGGGAASRAAEGVKLIGQASDMVRTSMQSMVGEISGLLGTLGQRSRGFAIASAALNAALRVGQIMADTAAAAMRALAELGPIAGPPAAAKIMAFGKAQAAIAAATAVLRGVGGGGSGGGSVGSVSGGGATTAAPREPDRRVLVQGLRRDDIITGGMLQEIIRANPGAIFDILLEEDRARGGVLMA